MKKFIIMGSIAAFVLISVSVFALQGKGARESIAQAEVAREVAPQEAPAGGSSGCGNGSGGCQTAGVSGGGCGGPVDPAQSEERINGIKGYLSTYYEQKLGIRNARIEVEDFGCHQEATVTADGKVIERLSISGNSITKIES